MTNAAKFSLSQTQILKKKNQAVTCQ